MTTYGVLGVGALARAVVTGLCRDVADPPDVVLSPRGAANAAALAERFATVRVADDNQGVVEAADVVLVCLPVDGIDVLGELVWRPEHVVVSAVAGPDVDRVRELVAPAARVCLCVPMPPVADRAGLTPVHPPLPEARALFDRLGGTLEVEDVAAYEALASPSATLSAFFAFLGTQSDWLVGRGVPAPDARRFVGAMYAGALGQLSGGESFDALSAEYATPGGYNEQVAREWRASGALEALVRALDGAHARLVGR